MSSIEDLMTPAERQESLEKSLSECLDDLLVAGNIEKPRKTRLVGGGGRGRAGFLFTVKEMPRINVQLAMFPNETEEPHFKVIYQNESCRFKISDCSPMKAEAQQGIPRHIAKIMKEIKTMWIQNKEEIVELWVASRPTDQHHGHQRIR